MEHFRAYVQKDRPISYVLGIGFLVFINYCGFYNGGTSQMAIAYTLFPNFRLCFKRLLSR